MGFTALASVAVMGAAGFAGAAPDGKPTKDQCATQGYSNYGQCVSAWAKSKAKPGYGNGGGNTNVINNEIHTETDGDNNTTITEVESTIIN